METVIIKIIGCSGIVLGLYYAFLAKEKTLVFNRFYLIIGIALSYMIPFISIELTKNVAEKSMLIFEQENPQSITHNVVQTESGSLDFQFLLMIIYSVICGLMLAKMLYSIFKIKTLKGRKMKYKDRNIFLLEQEMAPFTFWNTIYFSESYFKNNTIDERIFLHEEVHVKQKHTVDLLFIEVIKAFSWFNPYIYLYKSTVITNHEFIADEEVIYQNKNIKTYQQLILNEVLVQQNLKLTHQFNYNNTKIRFIMMTKKNSKFALAKRYVSIPAFAILTFVFAEKVYANPTLSEDSIPKQDSNYIQLFEKAKNIDLSKKNTILTDTITPSKSIKENIDKVHKETSTNHANVYNSESKGITNPEYPGGINIFRTEISKNFDGSVFPLTENGLHRAEINFTIEKDGSVTSISSIGNNEFFNKEATRVINKITENVKWKPATKDGEPIAYRFKLPLTMSFESFKK
ncbi:M56 family metallopeptidase [Chryseobacterium sp.]|uniref:M56 family metallopeptidase n=1 Tax=Chryseobacterium sp. TaxID=1871047 RepID=UPI00388E5962